MKKTLKVLIIIITSMFGLVYLYQLNKYMTLNDTDRDLILKSFGKDSDGKGYSDEGHRVMTEDLSQLKGQIPDGELEILEFFYKKTMVLQRIALLSKTQEEYLKNETLSLKVSQCWAEIIMDIPESFFQGKNSSFFFDRHFGESEEFRYYSDILFEKYTGSMSSMERNNLINIRTSESECFKFYKDFNDEK